MSKYEEIKATALKKELWKVGLSLRTARPKGKDWTKDLGKYYVWDKQAKLPVVKSVNVVKATVASVLASVKKS